MGEEEKLRSISHHGEKLAFAFSLTKKPNGVSPIRIMKNIRICDDCDVFLKLASIAVARPIIIRDSSKFHHFFGEVSIKLCYLLHFECFQKKDSQYHLHSVFCLIETR